MSSPIIQTKLFVPPLRPAHVERTALLDCLDQSVTAGQKLTLVSAPAGYGKTTLVVAWSQRLASPPAWYALDTADNDPVQFFSYLVAALQPFIPDASATLLPLLLSEATVSFQFIPRLINSFNDRDTPLILVLDDYHAITNPIIHESMIQLLTYLPPQVHLVITTRHAPPWPLARWRARHQMQTISAADLRFDTDEINQFLQESMAVTLPEKTVSILAGRTEGWIAGVQLAALSLQGLPLARQEAFVTTFGGQQQHVFDYLIDEVLAQQSPEIQQFLLQTAVLSRLCGSLCEAITGQQDGTAVLRQLNQMNHFIIPLDHEQQWYRYHPLFAEALAHRLTNQQSEAQLQQGYLRASRWHALNEDIHDAMDYALLANDLDWTIDLLVQYAPLILWGQGEIAAMNRWLTALAPEQIQDNPYLCLITVWQAIEALNLEKARTYHEIAEKLLASADEASRVYAWLLTTRGFMARVTDDLTQAITFAQQALTLLTSPEDQFLQAIVLINTLFCYYHLGDQTAVETTLHTLQQTGWLAEDSHIITLVMGIEADLHISQGRLVPAYKRLHEILVHKTTYGGYELANTGSIYAGLSHIHYHWNELDKARHYVQEALILGEAADNGDILLPAYQMDLTLRGLNKDQTGIQQTETKLQQVAQQTGFPDVQQQIELMLALSALRQNKLGPASEWAKKSGIQLTDQPNMAQVDRYVAWVKIQFTRYCQQLPSPSLAELTAFLTAMTETAVFRQRPNLYLLLLLAQLFWEQKQTDQARETLEKALTRGQVGNYIRLFVNEGAAVLSMLQAFSFESIDAAYSDRLLAAFAKETEPTVSPSTPTSAEQPLVESLSDREMSVLRLIASGLSNQAIADTLVISPHTVRSHIKNINSKLGAQSRTQAIARGHALNLL